MNEQEAYEYTDKVQKFYGTADLPIHYKSVLEWFGHVRVALARQIPKAVEWQERTNRFNEPTTEPFCPVCGCIVAEDENYCTYCGQRLSWEEDNDLDGSNSR